MPVTVQCPHPTCGYSFSIGDSGVVDCCPYCRGPIDPPSSKGPSPVGQSMSANPSWGDSLGPSTGSATWELPRGWLLADRYEIVRKLGSGGMASVYLAEDRRLSRPVALKIPHPQFLGDDPRSIARLVSEARSAARFDDPRICHIYDIGQADRWHYIVMRYVEGETLEDVLRRRAFAPAEAARLALSLAETLALAHSKKVIHRDLKPSNLMFGPNGELIIMDFGLAKRFDGADSAPMSEAGSFHGTVVYAAPEQFNTHLEELGPGCDIYTLGVILYRLLAGRLPFEGAHSLMIMHQILSVEPTPPSEHASKSFPDLDRVVLKAIAKSIDGRYASMDDFAVALREAIGREEMRLDEPESEPELEVKSDPDHGFELISEEPAEPLPAEPRPRPPAEVVSPSSGMKLILVEPGSFVMGSTEGDPDEAPPHEVRITRPFYLGACVVTQREYEKVVGRSPNHFKDHPRNPAEQVAWLDAARFCNLLSDKDGKPPFYRLDDRSATVDDWKGIGYRLPTEAEWEFACRAGRNARYGYGDDDSKLGNFAWYSANSSGRTHPVGTKRPNAWGFFDMHGLVWEWCWDGYDPAYYTKKVAVDPRGPDLGAKFRSLRGGNWRDDAANLRSANRIWFEPSIRLRYIGFRVASNADSGRR